MAKWKTPIKHKKFKTFKVMRPIGKPAFLNQVGGFNRQAFFKRAGATAGVAGGIWALNKFLNRKKNGNGKRGRVRVMRSALQGISQHNDTSSRSFNITIRKSRRRRNPNISNFRYNETWQGIATSARGEQGTAFFKVVGSRDMLIGSPSLIIGQQWTTGRSYYEINPFRTHTGSVIFPAGAAGTAVNNDRLYYRTVYGKLRLLNMENVAATLKIYWLMCKRDTSFDPGTMWSNILIDQRMGSSAQTRNTALGGVTAGAGYQIVQDLDTSPFALKDFKAAWKTLHTEKHIIQAGDEININFKFNMNRYISKEVIVQESPVQFLAGYTIVPFMILQGSLTGINALGTGNSNEVSVAPAKIGVLLQQTHIFEPTPAESRYPVGQTQTAHAVGPGDPTPILSSIINDIDAIAQIVTS